MKRGRVGYHHKIEFLAECEIEILKDSDVFWDNLCGRRKIPGSYHCEFANPERMQIIEMPDSDGPKANHQSFQTALPRLSIKNSAN